MLNSLNSSVQDGLVLLGGEDPVGANGVVNVERVR